MIFLLKCLFFLALVFIAIAYGEDARERVPAKKSMAAAVEPVRVERAQVQRAQVERNPVERNSVAERASAALSGFAGRATAHLTEAAREKCLAEPTECIRIADKVRRAVEAEPARR